MESLVRIEHISVRLLTGRIRPLTVRPYWWTRNTRPVSPRVKTVAARSRCLSVQRPVRTEHRPKFYRPSPVMVIVTSPHECNISKTGRKQYTRTTNKQPTITFIYIVTMQEVFTLEPCVIYMYYNKFAGFRPTGCCNLVNRLYTLSPL